jgi:hypothetical protein
MDLAPAAERTAGEAKPEILLEIAFRTMCQPLCPPTSGQRNEIQSELKR